jgi:ribosomal protein L11 methyltransferase
VDYIEAICSFSGDPSADVPDIVTALLAELGFESFEVAGNDVKAYIQEDCYDASALSALATAYASVISSFSVKKIVQENWNQAWESDFPITLIDRRCVVYAPFHSDVPDVPYKIVIRPQMSFGTGHHETTSLMLELLLDRDISGQNVLDMGCGTGILAILASVKNARLVMAIDIDEWAYANAVENCARNGATNVDVCQGGAELLAGRQFDMILANINRNTLLRDISAYAQCLQSGGLLQLSGFYTDDMPDITAEAAKNGLHYLQHKVKENWVAVQYVHAPAQ